MMRSALAVSILALVGVSFASELALALPSVELVVSTDTASYHKRPSVDGWDGRFVVVWESDADDAPGTDALDVRVRRVDSLGQLLGAELAVNAYTTGNQVEADVAVARGGDFTVVYRSACPTLECIYARRFDSSGQVLGGEVVVNDYTSSDRNSHPAIAMDVDGSFVVAWRATVSPGDDDSLTSIQARRFDSLGSPTAGQFQVNSYTTSSQQDPDVVFGAPDRYVVAWTSFGSLDGDASGSSVQARAFSGGVGANQVQVNAFTVSSQERPALAVAPDGAVRVAFQSAQPADVTDASGARGDDPSTIRLQGLSALDVPLGSDFQVNSYTSTSGVSYPAIGGRAAGDFLVAWVSNGSPGDDDDQTSIQGRRFDGAPGEQLQVNDATTGRQRIPRVDEDHLGNLIVVWDSTPAASVGSILARVLPGAIFVGDFEGGDVCAWSQAIPAPTCPTASTGR